MSFRSGELFTPSHPCRGGTTKSLLEKWISVLLPFPTISQV